VYGRSLTLAESELASLAIGCFGLKPSLEWLGTARRGTELYLSRRFFQSPQRAKRRQPCWSSARQRPNTWDRGFMLMLADLTTAWSAQARKTSTAVLVRWQRPLS